MITGSPFYYLLEDLPGVEVMLVTARHVQNLPGRKSDVSDATWLAQLGAHGLVRIYEDPGADYFSRLHPERAKNRALHQLEAMGYEVTLDRVG